LSQTEFKIFDPRDASTGSGGAELLDATVGFPDRRRPEKQLRPTAYAICRSTVTNKVPGHP
jgi:hypothetical protein